VDKLRLKFSKTGRAVYISHLDLMRTLQRVFSRAGVRLKYSEGFNPHAKISIVLPLTVGTRSECEYMDFALAEDYDLDTLPARLNPYMPEGIEALPEPLVAGPVVVVDRYDESARDTCFKLLSQRVFRALSRAWLNAGISMLARMAMMAITTSSSIKVKATPPGALRPVPVFPVFI